jgi:nitrite reductase/ring-hydroxylating ferredoxin subunit
MSHWVDLGALADLKFTPGAPVKVGDRWLAVFRVGGAYRAIDNRCPHASAPLCDGTQFDGKVACYLHCWEFDLQTGACDVGPEWNVGAYAVREVAGRLEVELPTHPPA